jgi:hypothetical protein
LRFGCFDQPKLPITRQSRWFSARFAHFRVVSLPFFKMRRLSQLGLFAVKVRSAIMAKIFRSHSFSRFNRIPSRC